MDQENVIRTQESLGFHDKPVYAKGVHDGVRMALRVAFRNSGLTVPSWLEETGDFGYPEG